MAATAANLALSGSPRRVLTQSAEPVETQLLRASHDSSVSFEEYIYWGSVKRLQEKEANERFLERRGPKTVWGTLKSRFSKRRVHYGARDASDFRLGGERERVERRGWGEGDKGDWHAGDKGDDSSGEGGMSPDEMMRITAEEWMMASRAMRTAGWSCVFYLITTDVLGPFSVP